MSRSCTRTSGHAASSVSAPRRLNPPSRDPGTASDLSSLMSAQPAPTAPFRDAAAPLITCSRLPNSRTYGVVLVNVKRFKITIGNLSHFNQEVRVSKHPNSSNNIQS